MEAFLGFGGFTSFGQFGLLAERVEPSRACTLTTSEFSADSLSATNPRKPCRLRGRTLTNRRWTSEFLGLLERQQDLILEGVGHRETILTAPAPISSVVVGTASAPLHPRPPPEPSSPTPCSSARTNSPVSRFEGNRRESRSAEHRLVHRGVVEASGYFIDPSITGDIEARRRIRNLDRPHTCLRGWRRSPGAAVEARSRRRTT